MYKGIYTEVERGSVKEFSAQLMRRRTELGLTYQELSNRTGISAATLQRYETGKIKKIPNAKLSLLAQGLNTTVEDFLCSDFEADVLQEAKVAYTTEPVVNMLALLGYQVETSETHMNENGLAHSTWSINSAINSADERSQLWIRDTRTQKCYEMSWEQFHDLIECIHSYTDFLAHRIIGSAKTIKRPTYWHKVLVLKKE